MKINYPVTIGAVLLILWPLFSRYTPLSNLLVAEILVYGLFAMSYNLALGYTGVLSFGHAAYFGLGAYMTAISLAVLHLPLEVSIINGCLLGTAAGMVIAFIAFRRSGAYFAIITLAISMVFYYIGMMWIDLTGGHDGITGIPLLKLSIGISLNSITKKYYLILLVFLLCVFLQWRIINSPFGSVLQSIRENEQRAGTCGYNTYWVKWWSFVISAFFSSVAGSMFIVLFETCELSLLYWTMSGTVLVITLFGGTGLFLGPFVGALVFIFMKDELSYYIEHWELFTGALFIAIVLLLPKGILGTLTDIFRRRSKELANDTDGVIGQEVSN